MGVEYSEANDSVTGYKLKQDAGNTLNNLDGMLHSDYE
jgi:hypothetical protein